MSRPIFASLCVLITICSLAWWWEQLHSGNGAVVVLFILWQGAFYYNGYLWARGLTWLARNLSLPGSASRTFPNLRQQTKEVVCR